MNQSVRLWGGRFRKPPDPRMMRLSSAATAHARLVPQDLAGGRAHAAELQRAGLLSAEEYRIILAGLDGIGRDVAAAGLAPGPEDEDVHSFVERVLVARIGATGAKLRAGRSRNDQAANNLKLYLRQQARVTGMMLADLLEALAAQAQTHAGSVCPGFTHLQSAQPVTFGHWLMAHAQALSRDASRLQDWDRRASLSPLGAAALAGSAIALQPALSAEALGYAGPCENSVDAVGSRDHVAEFLFVGAMLATNLSRLAEEVTLWTSRQLGWVVLDDGFATGSSIMPQKKNPDIAEITRGRAARLTGHLMAMMGALKGLPLAYNRDLAEDKPAAFDMVDVLGEVLPAFAGLVETMQPQPEVMRAQAASGFALATEVADHLARNGVPFAEAHEITGALIRYCEEMGRELEALDIVDLRAIDPRLDEGVLDVLTLDAAVAARSGHGGTAPERVREQIARYRDWLAGFRGWASEVTG